MDFKFNNIKVETYVPKQYIAELRKCLNDIGALTIGGNYDNCISISKVIGCWRPLQDANPFKGKVGELCEAQEYKLEFCCRKELAEKVISEIKKVHPYEEPVINILPMINF